MQTFIYIPQHLYLSHESPLDFCCSRVEKRVFPRATNNIVSLLRVDCQFHVVVSFTCTYHLENLWKLESCIYFLWFHFPNQEKKKKKKDHEHKFQKKKVNRLVQEKEKKKKKAS